MDDSIVFRGINQETYEAVIHMSPSNTDLSEESASFDHLKLSKKRLCSGQLILACQNNVNILKAIK